MKEMTTTDLRTTLRGAALCPQMPILGSIREDVHGISVSASIRRDGYAPVRGRSVAIRGVDATFVPSFTDAVHRSASLDPPV